MEFACLLMHMRLYGELKIGGHNSRIITMFGETTDRKEN